MKLSLIILFSDGVLDVPDGNGILNVPDGNGVLNENNVLDENNVPDENNVLDENNVPDENSVPDASKNKAAIAYCDAIAAICNVLSVYPFMLKRNSSLLRVLSICFMTKSIASRAVMSAMWLRSIHMRLSVV